MAERIRFTKTTAEKIALPERGEKIVWDVDVPSLGLRIRSSGSKGWLLKKGSDRWNLGQASEVGIEQARAAALALLAARAAGEKPGRKARPTVADVMEDYMRDHVKARCKPRTRAGYRTLLDSHILPRLGRLYADEISHRHIDGFMADMAEIKATANKCLALIKAAFAKALRWGTRSPAKGNPAFGTEPHFIAQRQTYLTAPELAAVLNALEDVSKRQGRWWAAMCLKTLAVTGCRRDEIRLLTEEQIDWTGSEVRWEDTKTGAGHLVLSSTALGLLREVADHPVQRDGRKWLFRGESAAIPLPAKTLYRAWASALEIAASVYGVDPRRLEGLHPHDLRHSFASLGLSSGLSLDDVRRLLRHRDAKSTARYAHHLPDRERELAVASEQFLKLDTPILDLQAAE